MGFSSLVKGVTLSPFKSSREGTTIDSVAIHTMASNGTAEGCGCWFADERANASSNYGVDGSGVIWGYVDESERAWCTSSWGVDSRSITIEVASTTNEEPFACTQEAYDALIKLLVDICQRYSITLKWKNDESYALKAAEGGPVTEQNMFVHRWFNRVKSCPGQYLFERHSQIAADVNSKLGVQSSKISTTVSSTTPTLKSTDSEKSTNVAKPTASSSTASQTSSSTSTSENTQTVTTSSLVQTIEKIYVGDRKIAFIGDSRMGAMQNVLHYNSHIWYCSSVASYKWITDTAVPNVEPKLSSGYAVCITISPTEAFNADASMYSEFINECASRWRENNILTYFISMNPVGTMTNGSYNGISNYMICEYNQRIRNGLNTNVGYIDTYSAIINNYTTTDGLNYSPDLSKAFYYLVEGAITSDDPSLYDNPAVIGGNIVQVDYTQLNPYITTVDRNTSDYLQYDKLKSEGVVGVIIEGGYLYDQYHKIVSFRQPKFKKQLELVKQYNLEYGFFFTIRSRTIAEAKSEMKEITFLLRSFPCKLGVWLKLELADNQISENNNIIDYFQKQLILLGFVAKIGFYIEKRMLNNFTWSRYSDTWLLWIVNHVDGEYEIQRVLDSSFFSIEW